MASQLPTPHSLLPSSLHVRSLPHHHHQLAAELQQRAQRGLASELQTHVGGANEPTEHGELRGQEGVLADHRVHFAQNQMQRVGFRSLCLLCQHKFDRTQSPRGELRAPHVPVLSDQIQVPIPVRIRAEPRLGSESIGLVHDQHYAVTLSSSEATRVRHVHQRDPATAVVRVVHQVVVVAGPADHHVHDLLPVERSLREDKEILRVRLEKRPRPRQRRYELVLLRQRRGQLQTGLEIHVDAPPHDENR